MRLIPCFSWLSGLYGCDRAFFVWFSWKVHANEFFIVALLDDSSLISGRNTGFFVSVR